VLGVHNITFLDHVLSVEGSYLDLKKIVDVENFLVLRTVTFLGPFWGLLATTTSLFLDM